MTPKWIVKTEPGTYSFDQLESDGRTVWDGVKNPQALGNIGRIQRGDGIAVYHTGKEKAVIGLAEALSDPYPDPEKNDARLLVFDIAAHGRLPRPVPLAEIKAIPELASFDLVRLPRLSVMPVSAAQWRHIARLGEGSGAG